MKTKILKLSTVILFLLFIGASCQDNEYLFEIQIGDKNAVIQKETDGIEFKFCLLNEEGEPSTIFNEGENFTFQFTIINNQNKAIYFDTSVTNAEGFCEVKGDSKNYGSPYKKPTYDNLIIQNSINKGEISGRNIKWIPEDDEWNLDVTHFVKANFQYLTKGKYYTEFSHAFDFNTVKIDKLSFRINFEIK